MQEYKCKKCGRPLEWCDTYRTSGGLQEGYLQEYQLWGCEKCAIDYCIIVKGLIESIEVIDIQEA